MTRRACSSAAAACLVLAVASCGGGTPPEAQPASAPASSSSSSPASAAGPGSAAASPSSGPPLPSPSVRVVEQYTDFASPSGNIACYVAERSVRCDIRERSWEPPPEPAGCELDWGQGIVLSTGPAAFVCAGDTALGARTVLPYGHSAVAGDLRCVSERTGMRCDNARTGHGFTVSREAYELR